MKTIFALGALAIVAAPLPAMAGQEPQPQITKTSDLDLRREGDLRKLQARLAANAARSCSVYSRTGTMLATTAEYKCRRDALERAQTRVAALVSRANRTAVASTNSGAPSAGGTVN